MKENFIEKRKEFGEIMKNGSALVIFAGAAPVRRGDQHYPYSPQRNLYYLTGIDRPNVILAIVKNPSGELQQKLYLERFDENFAKWNGAVIQKDEARNISGIENFGFIDDFLGIMALALNSGNIDTLYLDLENRSFVAPKSPDIEFAGRVRENYPHIAIENAYPLIGNMRKTKSAAEIQNIQKAVDITKEGFCALLRNVKPGMYEYELEAHLDYTYKKNGASAAFNTIMASGGNASVLHYGDNNSLIADGDLILSDFGAQWGWYAADVSRTFPANGRFTERQALLYNIVLAGQNLVIGMIKPGIEMGELNKALIEYYAEELTKIGLIKSREEISEYYYHGVSHMLGLETHDIGRRNDILAAGMVITVEPGLYIEKENIGIRIEEDVLVTENGCEVLTKDIIKTVEEIESYMAKHNNK